MNSDSLIRRAVVVGILQKGKQVLLCQRKRGSRYELKWEFPGGKVEPNESSEQALARELFEELDIRTEDFRLLKVEESDYGDGGRFTVSFFKVNSWMNEFRNNVFEAIEWVDIDKVLHYDILEGNVAFCRELSDHVI